MNRRKFIKAISMLAGALFVAPKALFARPVQTSWVFTEPPKKRKGLTMAKLVKAKRIMDAEQLPGKAYRMMYISETALDRCIKGGFSR